MKKQALKCLLPAKRGNREQILQNIFYCRTIVQSHGSKNSHGSTQRNEFIQTLNNKLFTGSSKEFGYNTFDDRPTIFQTSSLLPGLYKNDSSQAQPLILWFLISGARAALNSQKTLFLWHSGRRLSTELPILFLYSTNMKQSKSV